MTSTPKNHPLLRKCTSMLEFTSRESSHFFGGIPRGCLCCQHTLAASASGLSFSRDSCATRLFTSLSEYKKNIRNGKRDARPEQNWNIVSLIFWSPISRRRSLTIDSATRSNLGHSGTSNSINKHDRSRVRFSHSPDFSPFIAQFTNPRSRSISVTWETSGDQRAERGNVTGQQEGQTHPAGRGPAAILRRDAYAYHRVIVISARRGTQRSTPSDEGRAVHLVRVYILIAVVLPRGALL